MSGWNLHWVLGAVFLGASPVWAGPNDQAWSLLEACQDGDDDACRHAAALPGIPKRLAQAASTAPCWHFGRSCTIQAQPPTPRGTHARHLPRAGVVPFPLEGRPEFVGVEDNVLSFSSFSPVAAWLDLSTNVATWAKVPRPWNVTDVGNRGVVANRQIYGKTVLAVLGPHASYGIVVDGEVRKMALRPSWTDDGQVAFYAKGTLTLWQPETGAVWRHDMNTPPHARGLLWTYSTGVYTIVDPVTHKVIELDKVPGGYFTLGIFGGRVFSGRSKGGLGARGLDGELSLYDLDIIVDHGVRTNTHLWLVTRPPPADRMRPKRTLRAFDPDTVEPLDLTIPLWGGRLIPAGDALIVAPDPERLMAYQGPAWAYRTAPWPQVPPRQHVERVLRVPNVQALVTRDEPDLIVGPTPPGKLGKLHLGPLEGVRIARQGDRARPPESLGQVHVASGTVNLLPGTYRIDRSVDGAREVAEVRVRAGRTTEPSWLPAAELTTMQLIDPDGWPVPATTPYPCRGPSTDLLGRARVDCTGVQSELWPVVDGRTQRVVKFVNDSGLPKPLN